MKAGGIAERPRGGMSGLMAMLFTLRESKIRDVGAGLQTRPRADLKVGPYAIALLGSRVAATD